MKVDNSLKTMVRGASFFFFGLVFAKIFFYIYRLIVARMGTVEYGLLSLGFAVVGIVVSISLMGLDSGILRYVSFYRGRNNEREIRNILITSLKTTIPITIILSIALFLSSEWIALNIFHTIYMRGILKIFSVAIPFIVVGTIFLKVMNGYQKIEYEVISKFIVENIIKVVLTLILVFGLGLGMFGAAVAYVAAIAVSFFVAFYYLERKVFPFVKTLLKPSETSKYIFFYSMPLVMTSIIMILLGWMDTIMIGYFLNPGEVGVYNAALPTANLMNTMLLALMSLFVPVVTEHYAKNNKKEMQSIYTSITKWLFFINFPLFLFLIAYPEQILGILFGSDYTTGYIALSILLFGYLSNSIFASGVKILRVIEKTKLILINSLVAVGVNVALNYYFIQWYGIAGGAIATSLSLSLYAFLGIIETYKLTKMQPFNWKYLRILAAGLVSMILVYFGTIYLEHNLITLGATGVVFLVCYALLLSKTKAFEDNDVLLLTILENKIGRRVNILHKIIKV